MTRMIDTIKDRSQRVHIFELHQVVHRSRHQSNGVDHPLEYHTIFGDQLTYTV